MQVLERAPIFKISIHAPRAGSDLPVVRPTGAARNFNPRSPCGERLYLGVKADDIEHISIHAPRAGSDGLSIILSDDIVISIHAPRAGSDGRRACLRARREISIHAPRAGSDPGGSPRSGGSLDFNPRSPCGERPIAFVPADRIDEFQSTLPVRGATQYLLAIPHFVLFQSTLPVRGATNYPIYGSLFSVISIHAPRAGSDPNVRGRLAVGGISIHAPRAGSDAKLWTWRTGMWNFNPRSPCGERRDYMPDGKPRDLFQSTLPVRGATILTFIVFPPVLISIHAPRAGSDISSRFKLLRRRYFNPRSPCGERHRR